MFREALLGLFTVPGLSDYLGDVSLRTVQRWHANNAAPNAVIKLLQCLAGDLSIINPGWQGWRIGRDGLLYNPDGQAFSTGHVQAIVYQRQLTRHLKNQVRGFEQERRHFDFMTISANQG